MLWYYDGTTERFFGNTVLHYNGDAFVLCHCARCCLSDTCSDNEPTVVDGEELSAANILSLSNDGATSDDPEEKFISLCPVNFDSHRLCNQFAAMV